MMNDIGVTQACTGPHRPCWLGGPLLGFHKGKDPRSSPIFALEDIFWILGVVYICIYVIWILFVQNISLDLDHGESSTFVYEIRN